MTMRRTTVLAAIAMALLGGSGMAQPAASPLVGTWHSENPPQFPQTVLIFGADGYFAQISVPPNRSQPKNDFDHRTREELMKQFGGFRASFGTWKAEGTKLVRVRMASEEPAVEGTEGTAECRVDGDVLVLKSQNGQNEARFRRMK